MATEALCSTCSYLKTKDRIGIEGNGGAKLARCNACDRSYFYSDNYVWVEISDRARIQMEARGIKSVWLQ